MAPILPGATIGFLGGGQLGRMSAMAARSLGYGVHALDPDPQCPARAVVDRVVTGRFDDEAAALELARHCDVVTLEIEQIATGSLRAALRHAPVRPGPNVLDVVRDRGRQKAWLRERGFPLGDYRVVGSADELHAAIHALGGEVYLKARVGGYDGRSQVRLQHVDHATEGWATLGERPAVAERALDLELELSVMVARTPGGAVLAYPPAVNHHEQQVLAWSVIPGPVPPDVASRATELARDLATSLGVEGLLAVEMFLTGDGQLLVNELAPRPHNSFHATELACVTSQFEQLVRAVCDLPLGATDAPRAAAVVNLFGDLWIDRPAPQFERALAVSGARLFLYGKTHARPRRKMGHLAAVGDTPAAALERVQSAYAQLGP
ncbi:MAG: 5-(carboxyamino)imidazole ribonucleotide synthase [Gemmatimonadota bacterium]|nr:5-(carboxyamino)imidazole ribonucleotide synthase [Gemmatimonadota bacterium]